MSRILWGLLAACLALPVLADDRRFGSSRSRDYGRDGYALPRHQPVLPTRPFFVQPYPRNDARYGGRDSYRHGYREGYSDGYSSRDDRGRHRHQGRGDGYRNGYGGDWNSGYRNRPNYGYSGGYPNYYAPRPGVSIYYHDR